MPGRGSYGKGGKWIHDRAHHIMGKNPDMEKGTAYAIATQQAHKVGKSPKSFRTTEGVAEAKRKFSMPKSAYKKTAMPAMADEFQKIAEIAGSKRSTLKDDLIAAGANLYGGAIGEVVHHTVRAGSDGRMANAAASALAAPLGIIAADTAKAIVHSLRTGGISSKRAGPVPGTITGGKENARRALVGASIGAAIGGALSPKDASIPIVTGLMGATLAASSPKIKSLLKKTAAMGEDLRIKGPAGIRRPPFPTEGSKSLAFSKFKQSNRVGQYGNVKPPTPVI